MKVIDAINSDYGARIIHFGNLGGARPEWGDADNFPPSALYNPVGRESFCRITEFYADERVLTRQTRRVTRRSDSPDGCRGKQFLPCEHCGIHQSRILFPVK